MKAFPCHLLQGEFQNGGETQRPQNAQRILAEPLVRIAHTANPPGLQIRPPGEIVHQSHVRVVGHGVDGKIPAAQILPQTAGEPHRVGMPGVRISAVYAIGGNLYRAVLLDDRQRSMRQPGLRHCIAAQSVKDTCRFLRQGGGGHIPIGGRPSQQGIPHAAADHIGLVSAFIQRAKNIQHILRYGNHETRSFR